MKFLYPVPPNSIVTQTFAEHVARARAHGWNNYNGGIDWAVFTGTPIKAAQGGKVSIIRHDAAGYGAHVRLQHDNGYLSIYAHLASPSVQVGDEVEAGDVVGLSDNTGNSTGPHLHFELRHNNHPIDPMPLLVYSLEPEEGVDGDGDGESIATTAPDEFPELPKVNITAVAVNIRIGPGVENPTVGLIPGGTVIGVIDALQQGSDTWLQIGYQQYIAQEFAGNTLAEWVE